MIGAETMNGQKLDRAQGWFGSMAEAMPLTNGTGLQHAGEDSSEDMVPQIDRLNYMQVVVVF